MAIEVIKHGTSYQEERKIVPYNKRKYMLTCKKCGCEFSFLHTDARYLGFQPSVESPWELDGFWSIDCPECKQVNAFKEDELPYEEVKEVKEE